MRPRMLAVPLCLAASACATAQKPRAVDLQPARQALEAARAEGAPQKAPQSFTRAEDELREAESLVAAKSDASEAAVKAEWAARVALAEARCVAPEPAPASTVSPEDLRRLEARARRAEEDKRRLEEENAARRRELDVTETELIRTKARLKGLETRAEAASAIAETRILLRRAEGRRSADVVRAQEALGKADELLKEDNFGAAIFFASKAQDLVAKVTEPRTAATPGPDGERPPARPTGVVRSATANLRGEPSTTAAVLATVPRGTTLAALAVRGGWTKVKHGETVGWILSRLLE